MSASLLRRLVELGASDDMIDEVTDLIAQARSLSKRREADRERQSQRRRHVTSRDIADISDVTEHPSPSPSPNEILNPNPTPAPVDNTPAREEPVGLPIGASAEQWAGFVEMRRRIRKPLTARAQQLALRKLSILAENGQPPGAVLDQSTLNGWQDLFPLKDQRNGNRNFNRTDENSPGSTISAAARVFGGMAGR